MPKINVYLPDDLLTAVRDAGVPVSSVCQRALADAVAAAEGPDLTGAGAAGAGASDRDGDHDGLSRLTRRARWVVEHARDARKHPTSVDLVEAIVAEGHNLALGVLRALDVDPDDLLTEVRGRSKGRGANAGDGAEVVERAFEQSVALGHNFVGCEHLLLGLAAGPDGEVAADALRAMGVDSQGAQQAVLMMLRGLVWARDNSVYAGVSSAMRSALEEIRSRLARLESR